jgi:DNA-binding response OmpR family regulator
VSVTLKPDAGDRPRILLVEDEILIAMHIADALESLGFEVIGPHQTVARALSALENSQCCDAAILDAHLRDESAAPVATALAANGTPYVVATGYNRSQLPEILASAPILVKPVDIDELVTQLHGLLSQ